MSFSMKEKLQIKCAKCRINSRLRIIITYKHIVRGGSYYIVSIGSVRLNENFLLYYYPPKALDRTSNGYRT